MTSLLILDIFISMAFLYLTYSLLASFLAEWLSSILRFRANNLRKAIFRMLSDRPIPNRHQRAYYTPKVLSDALFNAFVQSPSIKYLGKRTGRPSEIAPENFADTLINVLADESKLESTTGNYEALAGGEKFELIKDTLETEYHAPPVDEKIPLNDFSFYIGKETQTQLIRLLEKSGNSLDKFKENLEKWYEEHTERSRGWFQSNMRTLNFMLGLIAAVVFNLDSIYIVQRLSDNPQALTAMVELAKATGQEDDIEDIDFKENMQVTSGTLYLEREAGSCFAKGQTLGYAFFGWLITAFAISFGSGFWFDLLNKLIRLRSTVPMPKADRRSKGNNAQNEEDYQG